jgi:hypothetical protein
MANATDVAEVLGVTEEELKFMSDHPCLEGPRENCRLYQSWFGSTHLCIDCINLNGGYVMKTGPDEKPRPVERAMKRLEATCPPLHRFVKKKYDL